jgi:HD domain
MPSRLPFWAKLGRETWPGKCHRTLCHLIGVREVARHTWDQVARRQVGEWVTAGLGLPDAFTTCVCPSFCAAMHDIGKLTPFLQPQGG